MIVLFRKTDSDSGCAFLPGRGVCGDSDFQTFLQRHEKRLGSGKYAVDDMLGRIMRRSWRGKERCGQATVVGVFVGCAVQ